MRSGSQSAQDRPTLQQAPTLHSCTEVEESTTFIMDTTTIPKKEERRSRSATCLRRPLLLLLPTASARMSSTMSFTCRPYAPKHYYRARFLRRHLTRKDHLSLLLPKPK